MYAESAYECRHIMCMYVYIYIYVFWGVFVMILYYSSIDFCVREHEDACTTYVLHNFRYRKTG